MPLPPRGLAPDAVLDQIRSARADDAGWREGRTWSLVYHAGDDHLELLKEAYGLYFSENGLSPAAFPGLARLERDVVSITAGLLSGPGAVGNLTSGGTESLLLAVKSARDAWAAKNAGTPELLLPVTAHPALIKGARYFGLTPVLVPVDDGLRADVSAMRDAIGPDTALVIGSAPCYPFGVMDPIPEIAALAAANDVPCHVDACFGGFLLPFVERLGHPVPPWDLRVDGVTSISADIHKYGYAAKGASVLLYRDRALRRRQFCAYGGWPGGLYGSPTIAGTRPGGAIAAAWAALHHLGEDGYLRLTGEIMGTVARLRAGIAGIDGLEVLGDPVASALAVGSDTLDLYVLGDRLQERGWHLDRQQRPPSLHLTVTPAHAAVVDAFLADLSELADEIRGAGPAQEGMAAVYGMLGAMPDGAMVEEAVLQFLDGLDAR